MQNSVPQFSVVIPTYNRGYCVAQAIESVQAQTVNDWEIIVVDDGSTDNTKEVVGTIMSKDSRVKYFYQANKGAATARNYGWQKATGDIIFYLDSDDVVYSNLLEKITQVMTEKPGTMFGLPNHHRHIVLINEKHEIIQEKPIFVAQGESSTLQDFFHWKVKMTNNYFHKRELNSEIKWNESLRFFEDWDFMMQLAKYYPNSFVHIPEPLLLYTQRYGADGICSEASYADWAKAFADIYFLHANDPLMQGQEWYPERVERYTAMQKQFEAGEIKSAKYKYFYLI